MTTSPGPPRVSPTSSFLGGMAHRLEVDDQVVFIQIEGFEHVASCLQIDGDLVDPCLLDHCDVDRHGALIDLAYQLALIRGPRAAPIRFLPCPRRYGEPCGSTRETTPRP